MSETLKHTRYKSNRVRFTLIELLIVVAIIGILAALLLPVLARAKRQAVRVADLNNRHQSMLAMLMYTQDNSSWYPLHTGPTGAWAAILIKYRSNPSLVDQLDDYVGDFRVWQCLGLPDTPLIDDPINTRSRGVYSNISYFANREYPNFGLGPDNMPNKVTHKNSKASMPILACKVRDHIAIGLGVRVGHSKTNSSFNNPFTDNPSYAWYTSWAMSDVEGACIAFMDGHVSWVRGNDLEFVGPDSYNSPVKQWAVLPE